MALSSIVTRLAPAELDRRPPASTGARRRVGLDAAGLAPLVGGLVHWLVLGLGVVTGLGTMGIIYTNPVTILDPAPLKPNLMVERRAARYAQLVSSSRSDRAAEPMFEYFDAGSDGQIVTRAMLFEDVWSYRFIPNSNLVDVHMGRLRRKVDEPGEPPMIHSVRGAGFVLRAPEA
jgi:hypothetical protein